MATATAVSAETLSVSSFTKGSSHMRSSVLGQRISVAQTTRASPAITPLRVVAGAQQSSHSGDSFASVSAVATSSQAPATTSNAFVSGLVGGGIVAAAFLAFANNKKAPAEATNSAPPVAPASKVPPIPRATQAAPAALETMAKFFPNAIQDERFVHLVAAELFKLGFSRDNCIAMVNTCRDEVCRPLVTTIDKEFGLSFNISGLGGLVNCGKTGLKAGMSHSPEFPCDVDGKPRERYVFFAFPHVSVGETGEVGSLLRRGRGKPSNACGALIAIKNTAANGPLPHDPLDDEFVLLKQKILSQPICKNTSADGLSLVTVTKAALQTITEDLESLISKTVNPETADYAVITGVQIHSGNQIPGEPFRIERTVDYVAAGTIYAVIRGKKHVFKAEDNEIKLAGAPFAVRG